MVSGGEYRDILKHPRRPNQWIFVVDINEYVWVVPFVLKESGTSIFLKTAFPSRRFQRCYGGSGETNQT